MSDVIGVCVRFAEERKKIKVTVSEIAKICGVNPKTVSRWSKSVPIPSDKLGLLHLEGLDTYYVITGERSKSLTQVSGSFQEYSTTTKTDFTGVNETSIVYGESQIVPMLCVPKNSDMEKWLNYLHVITPEDRSMIEPTVKALFDRATSQKEKTA